jgi:hypothetical protein
MIDGPTIDQVSLYLPQYLSPARQADLWNELRSFPNNRSIYTTRVVEPDLLQGDGWRGFVAIDFHSSARKVVSGLVLSNSCDVSASNRRALTPNITFVPLTRLERYVGRLHAGGQTAEQSESVVTAIKRQEVTSLMFLPAQGDIMPDSVALFDDVRAQPLDHFRAGERSLLFRLSDFGFYLFLFKLSIHFTRMLEGVER